MSRRTRSPKKTKRAERRIITAFLTGRKVLGMDAQKVKNRYPRDSEQIREMRQRDRDMKLPKFTSVGSYPIFYVTKRNDVACADCANDASSWQTKERGGIRAADVNYEDPDMHCEFCNGRIESAYAED